MSEKLTFAERVERMLAAAKDVHDAVDLLSPALEVVKAEAKSMLEAQARFTARKPKGSAITSPTSRIRGPCKS